MFQKWFYEEENYSVTLLRIGIKKKRFRHVQSYFCRIPDGFPLCRQSGTALSFTSTVVEICMSHKLATEQRRHC